MPTYTNLTLNRIEVSNLFDQDPATKNNGGFQSLLVKLQEKLDKKSFSLSLSPKDIERIFRYSWKYRNGGWQNRLLRIFGRTLPLLRMGGR